MFLFRHLFRRVPLNTTTRQIFGIERCKNVTKLKLFNYSSDASSTIKSAIFSRKNNLTKDLEKFQKKIIKYRQTSIRDIDRVLNLIRNNGSFDERLAYALLKCCGASSLWLNPSNCYLLSNFILQAMSFQRSCPNDVQNKQRKFGR